MTEHNLNTLRDLTHASTDLEIPWAYFQNHFNAAAFIRSCKPINAPSFLSAALDEISQHLLGYRLGYGPVMTLVSPDERLMHGAMMLGGGMVSFYFFEETCQGVAAVICPGSKHASLVRLTAVPLPFGTSTTDKRRSSASVN